MYTRLHVGNCVHVNLKNLCSSLLVDHVYCIRVYYVKMFYINYSMCICVYAFVKLDRFCDVNICKTSVKQSSAPLDKFDSSMLYMKYYAKIIISGG